MDKIRHQRIDNYLDALADDFPAEMALGLENLINTAHSLGSHIDWASLRIDTPESVYAMDMAGNRTEIQNGLMLTVDSILVEEVE